MEKPAPTPPPPSGKSATFADPAALMRIRNLELRARTVVDGFWRGIHRSRRHGFSSEFTEYRQYVAGDDTRYLDWKLLARSDRYYVRKFEEETNLGCHLLVDCSRSMEFTSTGYSKLEYARTLAATLAVFLRQQGDAVGLITFAGKVQDCVPARSKRSHVHEILASLARPSAAPGTALSAPIEQILRSVRRRGMVILISDLLAPIEDLETRLASLAACGHDVTLLQLLDPAELTFNFPSAAIFEDMESGRMVLTQPDAARSRYLARLEAHLAAVRAACSRQGILHHLCPTDQYLEKILFEHLADRSRRGRSSRRARQSA